MEIYIIRHGKTEFNRDGKMQGFADSPLLPESIELAEKLGEAFAKENIHFDEALSSDLLRANNTAKAIVKGMQSDHDVKIYENVKEMNFGQAEGQDIEEVWDKISAQFGYKNLEDVRKHVTGLEMFNLMHQVEDFNEAETHVEFETRIFKGLKEIAEDHQDKERVFVVVHGLVIGSLLEQLGYEADSNKSFDNLSVSCISYNDEKFNIEFVNKTYI